MKRIQNILLTAGLAFSLVTISCSQNNYPNGSSKTLPGDVVLKWNEIAYHAFGGTNYQHSLMAARINAMVHIAMHDAVNAVHPRYETYAFREININADPIAAAAAAAHAVLIHEVPDRKGYLDSALNETLSGIADGDAKRSGIALGREAGHAILLKRENDGSSGNPVVPVASSLVAGIYQAVPPFNFHFAPYWEDVALFGLLKKDQFRCPPPPDLSSEAYTAAFNEVKEVGKKNSAKRTAEETFYAKFWYEFSEAGWNRVARTVAVTKKLDLHESARLFALVDIAMADAYTAGWDSKLHYNLWRPYTAIRKAESDNNNETTPDAQWEPEQVTPPIQDYPSTHSALGNAAAVVMANILGDATAFTMPSPSAPAAGATRSFASFSQAAKENADSRVRAGIHFRFACDAGLQLGEHIGNYVTTNHLKPLNK